MLWAKARPLDALHHPSCTIDLKVLQEMDQCNIPALETTDQNGQDKMNY